MKSMYTKKNRLIIAAIVICILCTALFAFGGVAAETAMTDNDDVLSSNSTQTSSGTQTNVSSQNVNTSSSPDIGGDASSDNTTTSEVLNPSDTTSELSSSGTTGSNYDNTASNNGYEVFETDNTASGASSKSKKSNSKTSSKKKSIFNIFGNTDDGVDLDDWEGDNDDDDLQFETSSPKKDASIEDDKQLVNIERIIQYLFIIPILFIVASIVMLIVVNRKSFLKIQSSDDDGILTIDDILSTDTDNVADDETENTINDKEDEEDVKPKKVKAKKKKRNNVYHPNKK